MKAIFEVKNKDKDGRSEGIELLYIKKKELDQLQMFNCMSLNSKTLMTDIYDA